MRHRETSYSINASREYYHSLIGSNFQLATAEKPLLKKFRKAQYQRHIDSVMGLNWEEMDKLVDALTDLVAEPEDFSSYSKRAETLVRKFEKVEKIGDKLAVLRNAFEKKLSPHQQVAVYKSAIAKVRGKIWTIHSHARDDLGSVDEENLESMIITKQVLYQCLKFARAAEEAQASPARIDRKSTVFMFYLSMLLLRLEAARRGKIEYTALYNDLAATSPLTKNILVKEEEIGTIYDILGFVS
ncbi:hypothetical protein E3J38_02570 [candidate division TA06 bacterium]|uniref:Uncharacterized protein n=1 Tax=candidate division TA06 bacterium TaxID=2250710 RepID=A0A523XSB2_UNCT6|nr:MAG: hypothetical protein E3J38_02570 [candidate division TA06 bacterium]